MTAKQVRKITYWPNDELRAPTQFVGESFLNEARECADVLRDSLEAVPNGAALAANQVSIGLRMFAIDRKYAAESGLPDIVVDPTITDRIRSDVMDNEGCLSFPKITLKVPRCVSIRVMFRDLERVSRTGQLTGFLARMFQHEIDHLEGRLFIDRIDRKKRFEVEALMRKRH